MSSDMFVCKNCGKILHVEGDTPPAKCPHCYCDPTVKKPDAMTSLSKTLDRCNGIENDFWNFKLFITHKLVTWLWSLICGLSVLWMFFADEPTFFWRLLVVLLVALVSRIFFEFGVVLFSIADLLVEIRDALKQQSEKK